MNMCAFAAVVTMLLVPASGSNVQCPFRPDGYFVLDHSGPQPFRSIAYLALWDYQRERRAERPTGLYSRRGDHFALETSDIHTGPDGNGFFWDFTTSAVAGVSYRFAGKFTTICDFARPEVAPPGEVMLRGRMTRLINGNVAQSADVAFTFSLTEPEPVQAARVVRTPGRLATRPATKAAELAVAPEPARRSVRASLSLAARAR
jgi:hypothetical protein